MPKPSRRFFSDNICYHITTRGNQKQKIFFSNTDYVRYLSILKKAKKKYHISLYSYCLMPNHVHLLIETDSAKKIAGFMRWINRGYTAFFNAQYDKVGHLWQGRYKSKPILKNSYLIHCGQYIEANPVKANIVRDIGDYPWSSYKERSLCIKSFILDTPNI